MGHTSLDLMKGMKLRGGAKWSSRTSLYLPHDSAHMLRTLYLLYIPAQLMYTHIYPGCHPYAHISITQSPIELPTGAPECACGLTQHTRSRK